jgi:hypothetical protein
MVALSTLAERQLEYARCRILEEERLKVSQYLSISTGAFLDAFPLPLPTARSCLSGFKTFFRTPERTVVTPELCQ